MMRLMQVIRPPRFVLLGECHRCGRCCQHLLATPPSVVRRTFLLQIFLGYHRIVHRFIPVGTMGEDSLVLGCGHQRSDHRCGIYWKRPFLCRNYPLRPYFKPPDLMPGCGFRFAPRVVAAMRRRAALPIVNPGATVLHPTRANAKEDLPEDYTWVDDTDLMVAPPNKRSPS